ncbi:hypothetical protein EV368DRAFT_82494 [Lentinula lateritia]|nr:hypothetical protein EV368DRAFT_82494 [Lentinula lateritia]
MGRSSKEKGSAGGEEEVGEQWRLLTEAAAARSQRATSPSKLSASPWRPVVEIRKEKGKGREKVQVQPVGGDPDSSDDGNKDGNERDKCAACERCKSKKIPCQMQAGKRSSIICKPWGYNPTGERLAVLESQIAQLLANNVQLQEGQVKANTYYCHINRKLNWLMMDAARHRTLPPEMPEAGRLGLSKKRRRVVDSNEEEEKAREKESEKDEEEVPALKKARTAQSGKGKEKEREEDDKEEDKEKGNEGKGEKEKGKEEGEEEDGVPAPKKVKTAASEKGKEKEVD